MRKSHVEAEAEAEGYTCKLKDVWSCQKLREAARSLPGSLQEPALRTVGFRASGLWTCDSKCVWCYKLLLVCVVCYSSPRELIQWYKLMLLPVLAPARPLQVTEHLFPSLFRIKNWIRGMSQETLSSTQGAEGKGS